MAKPKRKSGPKPVTVPPAALKKLRFLNGRVVEAQATFQIYGEAVLDALGLPTSWGLNLKTGQLEPPKET